MAKKKFYAVVKGRKPGIYDLWSGRKGAEAQVKGFTGASYKGFANLADAKGWYSSETGGKEAVLYIKTAESELPGGLDHQDALRADKVVIYTDGGAINNPGPGGYGVVLLSGKKRQEFSGGFRLTTNNRMELTACIIGLKSLKNKRQVVLYSDSKYVVDSIEKGWARRWWANRWMKNKREKVENHDLWRQLLRLCDLHEVEFVWVAGHAGNPENERCDQLSRQAARQSNLPPDIQFEKQQEQSPTLF
jgi:ribonuclease HI